MNWGGVEVSGGALLAAAGLFYLDRSGVAAPVLLACLLHELGHVGAIRALGGQVKLLRITCAGAELRLSGAHPLPPGRMALAALAGPGVNLLLAAVLNVLARHGAGERLYFFAGLNLGLAFFNLLPARWLDGGKALESGAEALGWKRLGQRLTAVCSAAVTGGLLLFGALLLWQSEGRNFTLLIAGAWMLGTAWRSQRQTSLGKW